MLLQIVGLVGETYEEKYKESGKDTLERTRPKLSK
jgi:hypothetical protein